MTHIHTQHISELYKYPVALGCYLWLYAEKALSVSYFIMRDMILFTIHHIYFYNNASQNYKQNHISINWYFEWKLFSLYIRVRYVWVCTLVCVRSYACFSTPIMSTFEIKVIVKVWLVLIIDCHSDLWGEYSHSWNTNIPKFENKLFNDLE